MDRKVVLKIGGSLIYDLNLQIRKEFLAKLAGWTEKALGSYDQIIIATGGGKMSRHLSSQLAGTKIDSMNLYQLGMSVTWVSARILASFIGGDVAVPKTLGETVENIVHKENKVIIVGGFKPGWSSDMDAAVLADICHVTKIHKISNIEGIYTDDPRLVPDARVIKDMSWNQFFVQFGLTGGEKKDKPDMNTPIGSAAAYFAAKKGLTFFVSGGRTIDNANSFDEILESGSCVHP